MTSFTTGPGSLTVTTPNIISDQRCIGPEYKPFVIKFSNSNALLGCARSSLRTRSAFLTLICRLPSDHDGNGSSPNRLPSMGCDFNDDPNALALSMTQFKRYR